MFDGWHFRDVLRLTALFTARRGRSFLDKIASREARNFQFDFLRPSHSLYGYFNRMVEQYNKVLHPSDEQIELLKKGTENRWETLDDCRKRGEWEKVRKDKELKKKEESEKEALAFAEIDWQDFAVVQTIEFTSADESIELPPPTSVEALRTMGLNEKRMAAMIVEETADGDNGPQQGKKPDANGEMDVEVDDESESDETTAQKKREAEELARAKEVQAKAMGQAGLKIRKDYQPKGKHCLITGTSTHSVTDVLRYLLATQVLLDDRPLGQKSPWRFVHTVNNRFRKVKSLSTLESNFWIQDGENKSSSSNNVKPSRLNSLRMPMSQVRSKSWRVHELIYLGLPKKRKSASNRKKPSVRLERPRKPSFGMVTQPAKRRLLRPFKVASTWTSKSPLFIVRTSVFRKYLCHRQFCECVIDNVHTLQCWIGQRNRSSDGHASTSSPGGNATSTRGWCKHSRRWHCVYRCFHLSWTIRSQPADTRATREPLWSIRTVPRSTCL